MPDTQDGTTSVRPPTITYRDSICTAQDIYGADEPSDMCGPSTFVSLTDDHCSIGDASLVDDCNELIADIHALNGGGYWGMGQNRTLVMASHATCTFHIETKGDTHESAIGDGGDRGDGLHLQRHHSGYYLVDRWIESPSEDCA
ncbi:hypothetical protein VP1G_01027 [Cytospora mali]|uniref:Ecp2 effector protein-like domain-containing protein n=1 Tax=Cytospora mali TaxID=578113 RepID=A0A194UPM6_CYTMA|nr:hypothetical protein VP1G_01027 [Valsa mali var. pyri (nom. inval.)]